LPYTNISFRNSRSRFKLHELRISFLTNGTPSRPFEGRSNGCVVNTRNINTQTRTPDYMFTNQPKSRSTKATEFDLEVGRILFRANSLYLRRRVTAPTSLNNVQCGHTATRFIPNKLTPHLLIFGLGASSLHFLFGGQHDIKLKKFERSPIGKTTLASLGIIVYIFVFHYK